MRVAVVSPSVDRSHGTERALAELLEGLASHPKLEIHLYAQRVADVQMTLGRSGSFVWHRVPSIPGPHLFRFVFWFLLNRLCRAWHSAIRGLRFDVVFSAGINCSDANVVLVHAVFHRLAELAGSAPLSGLRDVHQRLYYRLLRFLEQRIYCDPRVRLAAVSGHTRSELLQYFGRTDVPVIPNGVDAVYFSPEKLTILRDSARARWNFRPDETVLLLIGNDWRTKGLPILLEALSLCGDLLLRALVVGQENPDFFLRRALGLGIRDRLRFARPEHDVRVFYSAADILVAPSLEDSFNLPVLEAMSCGLPVIVSKNAGVSEWLHPGQDAFVLRDPGSAQQLAGMLRLIVQRDRMRLMGGNAVGTARGLSWDRHVAGVFSLLQNAVHRRT